MEPGSDAGFGVRPAGVFPVARAGLGIEGGKEAMVSRATKRMWKGVALGLALGPVLAMEGVGHAQKVNQAPSVAAVKPTTSAPASKPGDVEAVVEKAGVTVVMLGRRMVANSA